MVYLLNFWYFVLPKPQNFPRGLTAPPNPQLLSKHLWCYLWKWLAMKKRLSSTLIENPVEHRRWIFWVEWLLIFSSCLIFAKISIVDIQLGSEFASGMLSLSWAKRFAVAVVVKSSNCLNCQNGLHSQGTNVKDIFCLIHTIILIWKYINEQIM